MERNACADGGSAPFSARAGLSTAQTPLRKPPGRILTPRSARVARVIPKGVISDALSIEETTTLGEQASSAAMDEKELMEAVESEIAAAEDVA